METFIKYPGGKTKEIPLVDRYKPNNIQRYFEPFVGGGSIYFNMNIADSFINDYSTDLYYLYTLVREQNDELYRLIIRLDILWRNLEFDTVPEDIVDDLGYTKEDFDRYYRQSLQRKNTRINKIEEETNLECDRTQLKITARKTAFYMIVRDAYNTSDDNIAHVACFYFLREYCYSSMFRFGKNGNFNVPYGGRSYDHKYLTNKINKMYNEDMRNYLRHTQIYNYDFEDFIRGFEYTENDFIFLDPPYDSEFSTYDNNEFGRNDQIRLRDCLADVNAKWMLIIKKTDFIKDLYKDFHIYEYDKRYMVSFKNRNDKDVKHLLITNYEVE